MLPDPLIRIQFRRVGREALQMDYFCPAIGQEIFDLRRTMDTGTVPNHQQLTAEIPRQMTQKGHAIQTCQGTYARPCCPLSSRRNATHYREMVARLEDLEDRRLATGSIRPDHASQQVKRRFVHTNDQPSLTPRFFSMPARRGYASWQSLAHCAECHG